MLDNSLLKYCGRRLSTCPDLKVEATVTNGRGEPLHVPVFTAYKAFNNRWDWNEWLNLPVNYMDLPRDANLTPDSNLAADVNLAPDANLIVDASLTKGSIQKEEMCETIILMASQALG